MNFAPICSPIGADILKVMSRANMDQHMSTGTTDLPVDPFRDREATNYENPIPSREMLLEVIRGFDYANQS